MTVSGEVHTLPTSVRREEVRIGELVGRYAPLERDGFRLIVETRGPITETQMAQLEDWANTGADIIEGIPGAVVHRIEVSK